MQLYGQQRSEVMCGGKVLGVALQHAGTCAPLTLLHLHRNKPTFQVQPDTRPLMLMCSCVSLKMVERLYTVCTFSNYCVCIVVCRVNGHALSVWNCKGRINVSRPSGKNLVLHSAAKDINSREKEWWSPTCGPNPDSLNPVPSHVSGHSKKPCWYLTDWNSISIIMLSRNHNSRSCDFLSHAT